jgi:hypothetical protein
MSMPLVPPLKTVSYRVRINSEEWEEFLTSPRASKKVADNIFAGNEAEVVFENAQSVDLVRSNFIRHIQEWLLQLGYDGPFWHEEIPGGARFRLVE